MLFPFDGNHSIVVIYIFKENSKLFKLKIQFIPILLMKKKFIV